MRFYNWLLRYPFRFVGVMLILLSGVWLLLTFCVLRPPRWDRSLSLGRDLLLLANFLVIVIGAIPPIAKWWSESVERLKESKPLVFTDLTIRDDGASDGYCIRNVGRAPAINVFYLRDGELPIALGSLQPNESRPLPTALTQHLAEAGDQRHLLLAQSRPLTGREWTTSVNVRTGGPGSPIYHAFATPRNVERAGTINDYLQAEGERLLVHLRGGFPIHVQPDRTRP